MSGVGCAAGRRDGCKWVRGAINQRFLKTHLICIWQPAASGAAQGTEGLGSAPAPCIMPRTPLCHPSCCLGKAPLSTPFSRTKTMQDQVGRSPKALAGN